jgi:hypothetical protein
MSFQIAALAPQIFEKYFTLSDSDLADHLAVRVTATKKPGFPCRVSLADAEIGDELILVNYQHQTGASPYRAAHAVYVRKGAAQARPEVDEIPDLLRIRTLSLRAFDDRAKILAAELVEGEDLDPALDRLLADPAVAYVHIHFAGHGCYAARADRA